MYMKDFSYANRRLSDFGCITGYLSTSINNNVLLCSNIIFETVKNKNTNMNQIIEAKYEEPKPFTFDIFKDPHKDDDMIFKDTEVSYIMKWLNKKRYEKFCPIYDDNSYAEVYFKGSFNISAIYVNSNIVGFTLTFTPNAPYGFESEKILSHSLESNGIFEFYNNSDEFGYLYPVKFVVKCLNDGDFSMSNNLDVRNVVKVKNCKNGETITFSCQEKIIQTDNESHSSICNDFNYNFPRFVSTEYENKNVFMVSMPCEITTTYSLIRKVGVIV